MCGQVPAINHRDGLGYCADCLEWQLGEEFKRNKKVYDETHSRA